MPHSSTNCVVRGLLHVESIGFGMIPCLESHKLLKGLQMDLHLTLLTLLTLPCPCYLDNLANADV